MDFDDYIAVHFFSYNFIFCPFFILTLQNLVSGLVNMVIVEPIRKNQRGVDSLIEELVKHRTWKYTLLVLSICINQFYASTSAYLSSFAGTDFTIIAIMFIRLNVI